LDVKDVKFEREIMKSILIAFSLFILLFIECNENGESVTPPVDDRVSFVINFLQYSENNYFIDKLYADTSAEFNTFNLYYGSKIPVIRPQYHVKYIEVFISIQQIYPYVNSFSANTFIDLPSRTLSALYSDSLRRDDITNVPGEIEMGRFRLLNEGSDYIFHPETGYITFLSPIMEEDIIAAAYRIENENPSATDDLIYGETLYELVNNSKTRGVLKLIKPRYLKPAYKDAWKLKMRNFYQILPYPDEITDLNIDIYLKKSDGTETNSINGIGLLKLFGFDKISVDGSPGSDGIFDNIAGINYLPQTNEIIFPVLEPFGHNIPNLLNDYKYQRFMIQPKII
jgi:cell surface protein SprA